MPKKDTWTICAYCNAECLKAKHYVNKGLPLFCNVQCAGKYRSKGQLINCKVCNKEIYRTLKLIAEGSVFCSHSCAARHSNKSINRPKASSKKDNCVCGDLKNKQSTTCNNCRMHLMYTIANASFLFKTFGEYKIKAKNRSYFYYNAMRRDVRRYVNLVLKWNKECFHCGYNFHVELCHIKPISSFLDSATMGEINSPLNLVYLCPNHHKEQEAGYLIIKKYEIMGVSSNDKTFG